MHDAPEHPGNVRITDQLMMLIGVCAISWLAMMLVHESGHVIGALMTGGHIVQVAWHPLVFSYTDVHPNPSPLLTVWLGPIVGVLLPTLIALVTRSIHRDATYLALFFAGFCFLANGVYLGLGWIDQVGDTGTMQTHGTPNWIMIVFGLINIPIGLYLWHRVSRKVGLARTRDTHIDPTHARIVFITAIAFFVIGLLVGHRG